MSRHNEIAEPGPTREGLLTLADTLAGLGVDVPDAEAFLERVLMPLPDAPTPPASLLRATDAELGAYAREVALHRTLADRERGVMADLASGVCVEFAGVLRAHADAIVDQLRPAFEDAITYARELAELGVTEDDTPATLITRDPQPRSADAFSWVGVRRLWMGRRVFSGCGHGWAAGLPGVSTGVPCCRAREGGWSGGGDGGGWAERCRVEDGKLVLPGPVAG